MKAEPNRPEHDIDAAYDSLKDATLGELFRESLFAATDGAGDFAALFDKTQTILSQSLRPLT
jgi:hypothetical protein